MHAGDGGRRQELDQGVAIAHRVEAVRRDPGEAEILRERLQVDRERRAGERRGAQRHRVGARAAVAEPLAVALQHEDVREEVVTEDDGLGALQMRVARQRRLDRLGGARDERLLHPPQTGPDACDHLSEIETLVDRDLIVARASGVQLAADLADQFL